MTFLPFAFGRMAAVIFARRAAWLSASLTMTWN